MGKSKKKQAIEEFKSEWCEYEIVNGEDKLPGFQVIDKRGEHFFIPYKEWTLEDCSDELWGEVETASGLYRLPVDVERFVVQYEGRYQEMANSGNYPEGHGLAEAFTREVLSELERALSQIDPLVVRLTNPRDYSILHTAMVHTYFVEDFDVSPLLLFDAERGSGKSSILDYMSAIGYRAFKTTSYSAASLPQLVDSHHLSLLLDEGTKNLKNRTYGDELSNILIDGFTQNEAKYVRVGGEHNDRVIVRRHYTSVTGTLLEDCPPDLKDRSIILPVLKNPSGFKPMKIFKLDPEEIRERTGEYPDDMMFPDEIRSRLYALRTLKNCYRVKGLPSPFSFAPFVTESKRELRHYEELDGETRFLYGFVYDFTRTPEFLGRAEDICLVYLPIAKALSVEKDIIEFMVDRISENSDLEITTESTILRSMMDVIGEKIEENSIRGTTEGSPEWLELAPVLKMISTKMINAKYREIRELRDNWEPYQLENPKKLTSIMKHMGFSYNTGTSGQSFFVPDDRFRKALHIAVLNYGGNEVKRYFSRI